MSWLSPEAGSSWSGSTLILLLTRVESNAALIDGWRGVGVAAVY